MFALVPLAAGLRPPPVELLGVAPVFEDGRNLGRPVYFCDVIVRRDARIQTFAGLKCGSWAYNDAASWSGYYCLLEKLAESGADEGFLTPCSARARTSTH